jgi:hypothetical protein
MELIDHPLPPILLEPGLRVTGMGTTSDGQWWIKFTNFTSGRLREVTVYVVAAKFTYRYAMRDKATDTILAYQGDYGDPSKDQSFIYGDQPPEA